MFTGNGRRSFEVLIFVLTDFVIYLTFCIRSFSQHDAAEFLVQLISRLEKEELKEEIADLFGGRMVQKIEYAVSGSTASSVTRTAFFPWTVDIPSNYMSVDRKAGKSCNLEDCLAETTRAEDMVWPNQYCLDNGCLVDARKQSMLEHCPKILVIHINRTSWSNHGVQKLQTHVSFPWYLSLDAFHVGGVDRRYELCSVVSHHGNQMSGGHFTAYGKSAHGAEWCHFNDAKVSMVSESEVKGTQAYLLMYEASE